MILRLNELSSIELQEPTLALDFDGEGPLIVEVEDREFVDKVNSTVLGNNLVTLPLPVVGLGSADTHVPDWVDVVIESDVELERIVRNVETNPHAASILVQTLRIIEGLSNLDALAVESFAYATLQSGPEHRHWVTNNRAAKSDQGTQDDGSPVLLNRSDAKLDLILNRPKQRNAISVEMRDALVEAFRLVALDRSIESVNVSAAGSCFSIGGELSEFGHVSDPATAHLIRSRILPARFVAGDADRYHFHIHRACIGAGLEIAAFGNTVTADPNAWFSLPELAMGLIPGAGGCVSISKRIGRRRLAYMVLMNKKISSKQALEWGLVDDIATKP